MDDTPGERMQPLPNGEKGEGRDPNSGRFVKGWKGGPGCPNAKWAAQWRDAFRDAVTPADNRCAPGARVEARRRGRDAGGAGPHRRRVRARHRVSGHPPHGPSRDQGQDPEDPTAHGPAPARHRRPQAPGGSPRAHRRLPGKAGAAPGRKPASGAARGQKGAVLRAKRQGSARRDSGRPRPPTSAETTSHEMCERSLTLPPRPDRHGDYP